MDTYVPSQPKIQNPDSWRNFLAKIYATNLAELTFFNLVCRLLRMEKRSEDGSDLQNYLKQVVPPSFIILSILPLSLPNVPLNCLEQTEYDLFFMEAYFVNYNLS